MSLVFVTSHYLLFFKHTLQYVSQAGNLDTIDYNLKNLCVPLKLYIDYSLFILFLMI